MIEDAKNACCQLVHLLRHVISSLQLHLLSVSLSPSRKIIVNYSQSAFKTFIIIIINFA